MKKTTEARAGTPDPGVGLECTGCILTDYWGDTPGPYWQCINCIRNKARNIPQDYFRAKQRKLNATSNERRK